MARARSKKATGSAPSADAPRTERVKATSESGTVSKGDIVWIDYEGWVVNPNGARTLFDTTRGDLAKKEGKFDEKKVYAEFPVIVGYARILTGLDDALLGAEVGKDLELTIPPERGAGERDPKLVELRPLREFLKQEVHPEVGMEVTVGGRKGLITQVTGGRVRVDYNNPLAGKTISYSYRVVRKAGTVEEKLRAVLEMDYGLPDQFKVDLTDDGAEIVLPDICKTDERWFVSKFRVIADLREMLDLKKVRFVEEYTKAPPKQELPKAEAKAEEPKPVPEAPREEKAEETPPPAVEERAEEELPPDEKAPEEL